MSLTRLRGEAYGPIRTEGETEALMEACSRWYKQEAGQSWVEALRLPPKAPDGGAGTRLSLARTLWGMSSSPQGADVLGR